MQKLLTDSSLVGSGAMGMTFADFSLSEMIQIV
jgi:hypothetical protein